MNIMKEDNLELQQNQNFLIKQLQKFLHIYTQKDQNQAYLFFTLMSSNQKLFSQIRTLLELTKKLKRSFQVIKANQQSVEISKNMGKMGQMQQDLVRDIPELVIKDVKKVRRAREENAVSVANKLKVVVCKTMQKESSRLRFNYSSYTSMLLEVLLKFHFDSSIEKMREEFDKIRKTFNIVNREIAKLYRHHSSAFVLGRFPVDFYVSFYYQRLLFFQDQPLPFNGNILFAPITLVRIPNKQTGKTVHTLVHTWYINELYKQNENWQSCCLQLLFKQTSTNKVKHHFCASFQKRANENQTCALLRKIRTFVYFGLVFNYLRCVVLQAGVGDFRRSVRVGMGEDIFLEVNLERQYFEDKPPNPRIIQDFLRYFQQQNIKKRAQMSKYEITQNLKNYLLCTLAKIKHNTNIPEQYIKLKPKYIYVGNKRVQI